jgi:hypothetical protein
MFHNMEPVSQNFFTAVIYGFHNKLECLSLKTRLGWKRSPGTNTLAYYWSIYYCLVLFVLYYRLYYCIVLYCIIVLYYSFLLLLAYYCQHFILFIAYEWAQ